MNIEVKDDLTSSLQLYMKATNKTMEEAVIRAGIDICWRAIRYTPIANKEKIYGELTKGYRTVLSITKTGKYRKRNKGARLTGKEAFEPAKIVYALLFSGKSPYRDLDYPAIGERKNKAIKMVKRTFSSRGHLKSGWVKPIQQLGSLASLFRLKSGPKPRIVPSSKSQSAKGGAEYVATDSIKALYLLNNAPGADTAGRAARDQAVAEAAKDKRDYAIKKMIEKGMKYSAT